MEPGPSSVSYPANRPPKISTGNMVMFRIPSGDIRAAKVEKDGTVSCGRLGSFDANELIDEEYGITYEIENKKLKPMPPRTFQDIEDTDATNELIIDGESVQPMTVEAITVMKQSGAHGSIIIQKQMDAHTSFNLKTEFSKEKYKKRKEAKYLGIITTIEPTIFNVCDYWFCKDQARIRDIRPDTLFQMLNLANVRPGGRYLAVDDASGIVVAGILDRMGGAGNLMTISDTESPPAYAAMTMMNFLPHVKVNVLRSLNWATMQSRHTSVTAPTELPSEDIKSDRQRHRLNKRKNVIDALNIMRSDLFAGGYDALVIASQYDPFSIIEALFPYLSGSANIVVHSPYVQVLTEIQQKMRNLPGFLFPCITEPWLRRYQILPGRTHPTMTTSGTGGYILHATKVLDTPVLSTNSADRAPKKIVDQEPEQMDTEITE